MLDKFEMKMDAFLPLRDVVFQTLRQAILREDLAPGERLMEIPLANKLGVSRTPLREAIRMLEQEGLVVMIPRRGAGRGAGLRAYDRRRYEGDEPGGGSIQCSRP